MNPVPSHPNPIARIIFASRWIQLPIYLGLIVVQMIYAWKFLKALWHLIVNLLLMVIVGGYETFVSRLNTDNHPDQPEWLDHVNASVLKVKLSMAIISISSIHLLQTFINASAIPAEKIQWQILLHLTFLLSALAMAYTDKIINSNHHAAQPHH